ncbi:retrovirus-related Pol polyprotein from transposon 17.6, partial [Trichonephila clavipes]
TKNSETLASSSSGIQKILELIFFATAIEKNVQQTVAAAMTIVTTCNFTFRSHPPLSRKPRLSIYTGDVLVTSSTVMLRTLKNGTAALGNHSLTYKIVNAQESDEYIRTIKKLLQEGKISEFIVSNKILYKISEDQELLVVPEMMQVDVIKKAHSFGHFAATKTEELLYPTQSTTAQEAIERLKLQQKTFGNPSRVINDKGGSKEFEDYCADEQISNVKITTGVPRGNGQEKNPEDVMIRNLLEEEQLFQYRDNLRREAKQNILKIQEENRRTYNRKRKEAHLYKKGDLVAIMRTQFGNKLKLRIKYFGSCQVTKVKPRDRYDVAKIGDHEGPNVTSASADQMKPWT